MIPSKVQHFKVESHSLKVREKDFINKVRSQKP